MLQFMFRLVLWILNCVLAFVVWFLMHKFVLNECGQCVFFGRVQEVKRIFTGGSMFWCLFIMSSCFVSFVNGAMVILTMCWRTKYKSDKIENYPLVSKPKYMLMLKISLIWTLVAAMICAVGFMVWCSSFEVNSCSTSASQDWNAFTPKHSDCFGANFWQILINVFMWLCVLIQCYDYSKTVLHRA